MDEGGKYIVFKRSDWEYHKSLPGCMPESMAIMDAHVIREQDMFAPAVLATYASAVQTAIEVIEEAGAAVPGYLFSVRDHFFMAANSSSQLSRKLPD